MPKRHLFDGMEQTVAEIVASLPIKVGHATVRKHLDAGRNTTAAIFNHDPVAVRRASGQAAAKRLRAGRRDTFCFQKRRAT